MPVTEERRQAVVIGSGFGGGLTASRLGLAGVKTLVLERGRRWPTGPGSDTLPTLMHDDHRSSWLSPVPTTPAVYVVRQELRGELNSQGEWLVECERIDTGGVVLERKRITTRALFLGAGSPGTTRLMVKARDKGLIPDLPDGVGTGWGTNGERVYLATTTQDSPGAYQAGRVSMGVRDWSDPARAFTLTMGPLPIPVDPHTYSVAGFMVTKQTGAWQYDAVRDDAVPVWDRTNELDTKPALDAAVEKLTSDTAFHLNTESNLLDDSTWHAVGGMPFGTAVDDAGRVLGQRGCMSWTARGSPAPARPATRR